MYAGSHDDNWIGIGQRVRDIARIAYHWTRDGFSSQTPSQRIVMTLFRPCHKALGPLCKRS